MQTANCIVFLKGGFEMSDQEKIHVALCNIGNIHLTRKMGEIIVFCSFNNHINFYFNESGVLEEIELYNSPSYHRNILQARHEWTGTLIGVRLEGDELYLYPNNAGLVKVNLRTGFLYTK